VTPQNQIWRATMKNLSSKTLWGTFNPMCQLRVKCIGQLILAQNLQETEEILEAIIVIAKSETKKFPREYLHLVKRISRK